MVFYTRWSICKMVSILSRVLYMVLGFCYMFHVKILWAVLRDIRAGSLSYFTIKKINKLRMPDKSVELMPQLSFTMFLSCVFFFFFFWRSILLCRSKSSSDWKWQYYFLLWSSSCISLLNFNKCSMTGEDELPESVLRATSAVIE